MVAVTVDFDDGDTLSAYQLDQNFADVVNALNQVRSGNMASDAGLVSTMLADRYAISEEPLQLLPYTITDDYTGAPDYVESITTAVTIYKERVSLPAGKEAFLCGIKVYCGSFTAGVGGEYAIVTVTKDGVTLGGGGIKIDTSDAHYRIAYSDMFAQPLATLQDGEEIVIQIESSGAASPVLSNISLKAVYKKELTS
jgi:hypothetical protein